MKNNDVSLAHFSLLDSKRFARVFFTLSLFLSAGFSIFASQKVLTFGGEGGWKNISEMKGVTLGSGKFGYDAVQLVTAVTDMDDTTDFLLSFDNDDVRDSTGHYEIKKNYLVYSDEAVKGKGCALSRGLGNGIVLSGGRNSFFGQTGLKGSFTIEFWICPALAESGETVFSWRSSRNVGRYADYQVISAVFAGNHLVWNFNNIFYGYKDEEIVLSGYSTIVPKKWSRHTVSFDEETGILEYMVDGRTESILYVTENGHENSSICHPVLGATADVEICPEYVGKIDNVCLSRSALDKNKNDIFATGNEKFKIDGGKITTEPILVSYSAVMEKVDALMSVPSQTEVRLYARSGDNCYGWSDSYPQWKEIVPGEKISGVSGLYFQLAAELLPDGGGSKTPSITELNITYSEHEEPLPPFVVQAIPGDGCVTVTWNYSVDDSAGGYYVYYGNRSGEYLGRIALEGASPVKAGNTTSMTLTGLQNGTIYYFAVSAYSKIDGKINGNLSKEVYARPSARLGMR